MYEYACCPQTDVDIPLRSEILLWPKRKNSSPTTLVRRVPGGCAETGSTAVYKSILAPPPLPPFSILHACSISTWHQPLLEAGRTAQLTCPRTAMILSHIFISACRVCALSALDVKSAFSTPIGCREASWRRRLVANKSSNGFLYRGLKIARHCHDTAQFCAGSNSAGRLLQNV